MKTEKKQDMKKALLSNIRTQTSHMHSWNEGHVEAAQKEKDERKKEETQPAMDWMFVSPCPPPQKKMCMLMP